LPPAAPAIRTKRSQWRTPDERATPVAAKLDFDWSEKVAANE
jgi:hypothetical protein